MTAFSTPSPLARGAQILLALFGTTLAHAAVHPLTLVPTLQLRPSSDGEAPRLGVAMAYTTSYGGTLLVGMPGEDGTDDDVGSVAVHRRTNGVWERVVQVGAPSAFRQSGSGYGNAVAVAGEWAVVGAPDEDVDGKVDAGAAYILRYNPGNTYYQNFLRVTGSIVQANAHFGAAVAVGGGIVAIGQPGYDQDSIDTDTGRVQFYRYESGSDDWFLNGGLLSPAETANESFGATLFLQDVAGSTPDRLFVGAPTSTVNGQAVAGRVHHYRKNGTGWDFRESMQWLPSELLDWYGSAIAASGDYLFIGAHGRTKPGGAAKGGAVEVQKIDALGFYQPLRELYPDNEQSGARFGASVAVSQTFPPRLIIGAPRHDVFNIVTRTDAGRAYVFDPALTLDYEWLETNALGMHGGAGSNDELGSAVAILTLSTAIAFAGAPGRFASVADAGRVQVYNGDGIFEDGYQ